MSSNPASIELRSQGALAPSWVLGLSHELGGPIAVLRGYASIWADSPERGTNLNRTGQAIFADAEGLATGLQDFLRTVRLVTQQTDPFLAAALVVFESIARPATLRIRTILERHLSESGQGASIAAVQTCHTSTALLLGLIDQLGLGIGLRDVAAQGLTVVNLETLTRSLIHDVAAGAAARGHRLLLQGGGRQCFVLVTVDLLEAAVLNLIDNAQKHSPSDLPVLMVVSQAGGRALLCVGDRGPGLPRATVPTAFLRVDQPLAFPLPGLGLGLVIAAKIADLHGGRLLYAPRDGGGSEFTIELPLMT